MYLGHMYAVRVCIDIVESEAGMSLQLALVRFLSVLCLELYLNIVKHLRTLLQIDVSIN